MADRINAQLDHIAVAVPDADKAERRWRDELGGGLVTWGEFPSFHNRQLRYNGGAKIELIEPPPGADERNFVVGFLRRFGAHVHHVTLKVPALEPAVATIRDAGFDVVDVRTDNPSWHEGFLRPSQVGGMVVQVAWAGNTDEEWAAQVGHTPEEPRADDPVLVGVVLRHPDIRAASALWQLLGAQVEAQPDGLICSWPDSPAGVVIRHGEVAGPEALLFAGTEPLPASEGIGPAIQTVPGS
jgi:catechol 2,3-dioxygenase-like lactoylglutathione lyase family enzyme